MACDHPNEEWTVFTTTDTTSKRALLVFCLLINGGGKITGFVSELPLDEDGTVIGDPIDLGKVKGHQDTTTDPNVNVLTLDFNWGGSKVIVAGIRFKSAAPNTFAGRFTAFGGAGRAAAAGAQPSSGATTVASAAPADGDTGTATGTQT